MANRISGLDFSDGDGPNKFIEQHPDLQGKGNGVHLQRNKTERRRLQGLQRTLTNVSTNSGPAKPRSFANKFNTWMINEGGRRIFFFVFILLHCLVIAFGFMNYQLKDNSVTARSIFGITFRMYLPFSSSIIIRSIC